MIGEPSGWVEVWQFSDHVVWLNYPSGRSKRAKHVRLLDDHASSHQPRHQPLGRWPDGRCKFHAVHHMPYCHTGSNGRQRPSSGANKRLPKLKLELVSNLGPFFFRPKTKSQDSGAAVRPVAVCGKYPCITNCHVSSPCKYLGTLTVYCETVAVVCTSVQSLTLAAELGAPTGMRCGSTMTICVKNLAVSSTDALIVQLCPSACMPI